LAKHKESLKPKKAKSSRWHFKTFLDSKKKKSAAHKKKRGTFGDKIKNTH